MGCAIHVLHDPRGQKEALCRFGSRSFSFFFFSFFPWFFFFCFFLCFLSLPFTLCLTFSFLVLGLKAHLLWKLFLLLGLPLFRTFLFSFFFLSFLSAIFVVFPWFYFVVSFSLPHGFISLFCFPLFLLCNVGFYFYLSPLSRFVMFHQVCVSIDFLVSF